MTVIVLALVVLVVEVIAVGLLLPRLVRPVGLGANAISTEAQVREAAQGFLEQVQISHNDLACTFVLEGGSLLNPCFIDLDARDLTPITELPRPVKVRSAQVNGDRAVVANADITPRPVPAFTLTLKRTQGIWLVEGINGTPITKK